MNEERQQGLETYRFTSTDDQEYQTKRNNKGITSPLDVAEHTTIAVIVNAIMGTLFYLFSTNIDNYQSSECVSLRIWGLGYAIFCISVVFFRLFIFLPVNCYIQQQNPNKVKFWVQCLIIQQSIEIVISFIFLFGLTVTYFFNEPCGNLRELIQVYLIILYSLLSLAFCMGCGLAVFITKTCLNRKIVNDDEEQTNNII